MSTLYLSPDKSIHPSDYLRIKIDLAFRALSALNSDNNEIKNYAVLTSMEKEKLNYSKDDLLYRLKDCLHCLSEIIDDIDKTVY